VPTLIGQLGIQESIMGPWLAQQSLMANVLRLFNELTALAWPGGRPFLWMGLLLLGMLRIAFWLDRSEATPALELRYPLTLAHTLTVVGLLFPMLAGAYLSARGPGLTPSYVTMAVLPSLCLLLARGIRSLRYPWIMVVVLSGLAFLWLRIDLGMYGSPVSVLREVARYVDRNAEEGDVIVIAPDYIAPTLNFYFHGSQAQTVFPGLPYRVETMDWVGWAERRHRAAEAIPETLDYIAEKRAPTGKVWLVAPIEAYPGDPFFEEIRALKAALDTRYRLVDSHTDWRTAVETADVFVYAPR
jgi:hypothetical protein